MKIERQGVVITDIPGVEYIRADPGQVTIKFDTEFGGITQFWGTEELPALIEGLQAALLAEVRPVTAAAKTGLPRVFHAEDQLPADVTRVRDKDDDTWFRETDGTWSVAGGPASYIHQSPHRMFTFAPLTEILP